MSNTIRRKTTALPEFFRNKYVYLGGYVPRDAEELKEKLIEFHADWGAGHHKWSRPKWFRKEQQSQFKMKIKNELSQFWKDPEYEVQLDGKYKNDWY